MKGSNVKSIYLLIHTSFSTLSIAFFIGLLSADKSTINALSIEIASVFFCISIVLNAGLSIFLMIFGDIRIYVNRVYTTIFPWNDFGLPALAIFSFVLAVLVLFSYYSCAYVFIAIIAIVWTSMHIQSIIKKANAVSFKDNQDSE